MITLDLQSRQPIYEQLRDKIINLIMLEVLTPDQQLPSVRTLARDLGVNPNTVQKAYQELEREGIIYSVGGKGSFVSSNLEAKDMQMEQAVNKLYQAVREVKNSGISREKAIQITESVYSEEETGQ